MAEDENEMRNAEEIVWRQRRLLWINGGTVVTGVGLFVGFMFYHGLLGGLVGLGGVGSSMSGGGDVDADDGNGGGNGTKGKGALADFGDAGAALEVLGRQMDFEMEGLGSGLASGEA